MMRRLLHYAFTAVAMVAFAQNVNAQCGPQNIPVSQDFSSWPLACWNDSLGTETVQDGGGYAEFNYWSWSSGKTGILRSDTIVVTSDARVKFKWSKKLYSATSADALTLRMRNVNSATWDTIWHRSGTAFQSNDGASNTSPGSFAQEIIALNTSYTGDSVEFEFYGYSGYGSDAWVDDFLVEALPLCPEPLALGAKSITSSSATLFWQSNGTAFNVEYGPVGFIQGTGTSVTASADSVVINNLASNSCFDYYVQTDCAPNNGTSIWSGPFTFCTLCSAISTPIVENFDGATPGSSTDPSEPSCWTYTETANHPGSGYTYQYSSPNSAPHHWYMTNSNGSSSDVQMLVSPEVDSITTKNVEVIFMAKGNGYDLIVGTMSDPDNPATFNSIDTLTLSSGYMSYTVKVDAANGYNGTDKFIAFRHGNTSTYQSIYLDDITIQRIPSCYYSSNFVASMIMPTSATISWTTGGSLTNTIEYGPSGFTQGTGMMVYGITGGSYNMTSLFSNTCYDVYVQDSCASGQSPFVGPFTFCTPCLAQNMPYVENFDAWPINCYDVDLGTQPWVEEVATGGSHAKANFWSYNSSHNFIMMSPPVNVTQKAQVKFSWSRYAGTSYDDRLVVIAHSSGSAIPDTLFDEEGGNLETAGGGYQSPGTFQNELFYLDSMKYVGNTVTLEFVGLSDYGPSLFIDDVIVEAQPVCPDPTALGATNIQGYQATLNWSAVGGTQFFIEYGPQGFAQATGGGIYDTTATTSITLMNLDTTTCYDYYVQADCGSGGGTSAWVGPYTFCTTVSCPAPSAIMDSATTTTTAYIHWTTAGASDWNLIWAPAGAGMAAGTQVNVTGGVSSTQLTGLTNCTSYDVWVRDSCGMGDASLWTGPYTFSTLALTQSLPYSENFDNGLGCWIVVDGGTTPDTWFGSTGYGFNNATLDGTGFAFVDSDGAGSGNTLVEEVISPAVDASGTINLPLTLEFDQYYNNGGSDSAYVDVWDGTQWINILAQGSDIGAFGAPDHQTLDISAYANANVKVRFRYEDNNVWAWYWAVDNVLIQEAPTCDVPTAVKDTLTTITTSTIKWTTGGATDWNLSWGPSGTAAGAGTWVNVSGTPEAMLTGLSGCTAYDVWVRDSCGAGDVSAWAGPYTFTTQTTTQSLPYMENFDNGLGCWSVVDSGTTADTWYGETKYNNFNDLDGTPFAFVDSDGAGSGNHLKEELISPAIDASGTLSLPLTIEFDQYYYNIGSDSAWVDVWDGTQWVNVLAQGSDVGSWATPDHQSIDISMYANANLKVRFRYDDANVWAWYWAVDNFAVQESGSCPAPTGLTATNIACDSATISWTSDTAIVYTAVVYDTAGFDPLTGGTVMAGTSSPINLSNLTPGTSYDVYVLDSCSSGVVTAMTNFTTAVAPLPGISYTVNQSNTTATNATVDFDASATTDGTTFSWTYNNGASTASGATMQAIYTQNGTDTITLSVTNGCGVSDTTFTVDVYGISIAESVLEQSLNVYPNPNSGKFRIEFTTEGVNKTEVNVVNALGQVIYNEALGNVAGQQNIDVDLTNEAKGMYVVKVKSNGVTSFRKITVQ